MKLKKYNITNDKHYESKQDEIRKHNYFIDRNLKLDKDLRPYIDKGDHTKCVDNSKFIDKLAEKFKCQYIIDIGCTNINDLLKLNTKYKIIGINLNITNDLIKDNSIDYINCNLKSAEKINIPKEILQKSIIICSNVIEKIKNIGYLLSNINNFMKYSRIGIITTLDRLITMEDDAKWTMSEFKKVLEFYNYNLDFIGLSNKDSYLKDNILCILGNNKVSRNKKDIEDFRVVAIMPAYNEEDILYDSVLHLIKNGVEVYIIENWSNDSTFKIVEKLYKENKIIGFERLPKNGPCKYGKLEEILRRIEKLTKEIESNWFFLKGVDEIIESPWEDITLKEAIYTVNSMGYNAIDHNLINFKPIDNGFTKGDFEKYFNYFAFYKDRLPFIRMWKNTNQNISIVPSGGHNVGFNNRRVYPFKFLIKHYTVRSQSHGLKKILNDRKNRWDPEEFKYWHKHYRRFNSKTNFIKDPKKLIFYDKKIFMQYFLLERLLGIYEYGQCMRKAMYNDKIN